MDTHRTNLLSHALLHSNRWPVFPCKDKKPITKHGCKDATKDRETIRKWWNDNSQAQIGVVTGKASGLFVLDVDVSDDKNGFETLAEYTKTYGELPETRCQKTARGGRHYFFEYPKGQKLSNSAGKLGAGLDTRGEGGYVIIAPSPGYEWIDEGAETPLAPVPGWLLQALTPKPIAKPAPPEPAKPLAWRPQEQNQNDKYSAAALQGILSDMSAAPQGARNATLNRLALRMGQLVAGGILPETACSDLINAAIATGLPEHEARKTFQSGYSAGLKEPATRPERDYTPATAPQRGANNTTNATAQTPARADGEHLPDTCSESMTGEEYADTTERPNVNGYVWQADGLHKIIKGKKDSDPDLPNWIAPPFTLPGLCSSENGQDWGLLMEWQDARGRRHDAVILSRHLKGEGESALDTLSNGGLFLPSDAGLRKHLIGYLSRARALLKRHITTVQKLGWHNGAFLLPGSEVIGEPIEPVRFSGNSSYNHTQTRGGLDDWKKNVARFGRGNPFLTFSLCVPFAAPLLNLYNNDGGGFNLYGDSSKGKSTCLKAAASVWGHVEKLPTWRGTSNGIEGQAAARNDGFLPIDEMSQAEPKTIGSIAYMLANGASKMTMNRNRDTLPTVEWRLLFLSTGEHDLERLLRKNKEETKAGQDVRIIDIPCPDAGLFRDFHEYTNNPNPGKDFAENLSKQARTFCGQPIRAFLQRVCNELTSNQESFESKLYDLKKEWLALALDDAKKYDPQVLRVADRFAIVAVAGELAVGWNILPWEQNEANYSVIELFREWLKIQRGHTGAAEAHKGIENILAFIAKHPGRFDNADDDDAVDVRDRCGSKKKNNIGEYDYYFTPEGFKEACGDIDHRRAANACVDCGLLERDSHQKTSRIAKVGKHAKARYYIFKAAAIAHYQETESDP